MKQFNCNVLGQNCDTVLRAPTEERLVELASIHLRDVHNFSTITPDTVGKIKNSFINRTASDAANVVDRIFEKYNCSGEPECTSRYIEEAEMILHGGTKARERELLRAA
jgi:predicted small metal-binding protein